MPTINDVEQQMASTSTRQAARAAAALPFFIGVGDALALAGLSPSSRDLFYSWSRTASDFPKLQRLGRRTVIQRAAFVDWLAKRPAHRLDGVGACSRPTKGPAVPSAVEGAG